MRLSFLAFWAINDRLDEARLMPQLDAMKRLGFDGVVWHPRFYPGEPEYLGEDYFSILSRVILHAKSLGLAFWIYDENGWPSGTVGGEMLRLHPDLRQQWIELVEAKPDDCLAEFVRDGKTWFVGRRDGDGVDYLNPDLAPAFLEMTYERHRDELAPEAFEHVSTFFCDEPEFGIGHAFDEVSPHGALPWTSRMPVEADFEDLFFIGKTRRTFIEGLTERFNQGFTAPINSWCKAHGKRFTAHVKGEEHPLFQVAMVGSCQPFFRNLTLPGIDALERDPSGDYFPRQVSSVARQHGDGRCMVECFGGAGWGASADDLEHSLRWLVRNGLTDFVTHLWQYRFTSHAMRDWPVSFPNHVTWKEEFPEVLRRVKDYSAGLDRSIDTLLVAPHRAIMREYGPAEIKHANIHNGADWPDSPASRLNNHFIQLCERAEAAGMKWHVIDEADLAEFGQVENGSLTIGRMVYQKVLLSEGADVESTILEKLRPLLVEMEVPDENVVVSTPVETETRCEDWELQAAPLNDFVLEARNGAPFRAVFQADEGITVQPCFLDDVSKVMANGRPLSAGESFATIDGGNVLEFQCADPMPWVSLRGDFRVLSKSPWRDGPNDTRSTEGPFVMRKSADFDASDLLACGFPFCRETITLKGDSRTVALTPSSFNAYGPHHHVDGDPHIVSPAQFEYRKNFADRPDAPESTRVAAWHFKPFGI